MKVSYSEYTGIYISRQFPFSSVNWFVMGTYIFLLVQLSGVLASD